MPRLMFGENEMTDSATATIEAYTSETEYWGDESGIASPPGAPKMNYNERSARSKYTELPPWTEKEDELLKALEASFKETMESLISDKYKFGSTEDREHERDISIKIPRKTVTTYILEVDPVRNRKRRMKIFVDERYLMPDDESR